MDGLYLSIIKKTYSTKVRVSDVICVEKVERKWRIRTDHEEHMVYASPDELARVLPDSFARCNCGTFINLSRVKQMSGMEVVFDTGNMIVLGRDAFLKARREYNEYLRNNCLTLAR